MRSRRPAPELHVSYDGIQGRPTYAGLRYHQP